MLNREGYRYQNGQKLAENGIWGTKTEYAWKKFQQDADKKAASSQSKGGQLLQQKIQEDVATILNKQLDRAKSTRQTPAPLARPPAPSVNDASAKKLRAAMLADPEAGCTFSVPDQIRDQQIALNLLGFTGADGRPLPETGVLDLNTLVAWDRLRHSGSSFGNSNSPVMQAVKGKAGSQVAAPATNWLEQQVKSGTKQILTQAIKNQAIKKLDKILEQQYPISRSTDQRIVRNASIKNLNKPAGVSFLAKTADQRFDYAMSSIEKNYAIIEAAHQRWGVPPEMIASIILKEQYTRSIPDWLANYATSKASSPIGLAAQKISTTLQKSENETIDHLATKINAPFGPHSTGLGAIFPETAREAWESALGKEKASQILPRNDLALQLMLATNDQFNINTIGAVLKYEAAKLSYTDISSLSDDQWQKVIKAYNGGGDKGKEYAQKVQQYLNPMREYLYSLNK